MRLGTVLAALIFTSAAVALAVWLGQPASPSDGTASRPTEYTDDWPEISKTGPHPQAVASETQHDFGKMAPGEQRTHTFVIRNEGQAPLVLAKGHHTCKCTLSELANRSIPPGETGEVTLTWHPESAQPEFSQSAEIRTNDPETRSITFVIEGMIEDIVRIDPPQVWMVGEVQADEPAVVTGTIVSSYFDEFNIVECSGATDGVTAEAIPADPETLKALDAKSGYTIKATVQPVGPLGQFREEIIVRTDIRDGTEHRIPITGHRLGPVHFVPLRGVKWIGEVLKASLGRFPANEGKQASLLMFVTVPAGQSLVIDRVETSPDFLKATLEQDSEFRAENRVRYRLTIAVPPGLPPETRIGKNAGTVTLTTNHPGAPEIAIRVEFVTHRDS